MHLYHLIGDLDLLQWIGDENNNSIYFERLQLLRCLATVTWPPPSTSPSPTEWPVMIYLLLLSTLDELNHIGSPRLTPADLCTSGGWRWSIHRYLALSTGVIWLNKYSPPEQWIKCLVWVTFCCHQTFIIIIIIICKPQSWVNTATRR